MRFLIRILARAMARQLERGAVDGALAVRFTGGRAVGHEKVEALVAALAGMGIGA